MRVDDLDVLETRAGPRQQTVIDCQFDFSDDRQLVLDEQVVVAVDAATDGVLHRHDSARHAPFRHGGKDVVKAAARDRLGVRRKKQRRRFAISPWFSLICDAHDAAPLLACQP